MAEKDKPKQSERDEPAAFPLDPEVALRALLKVVPDDEPVPQDEPDKQQGDPLDH